MRYGSGMGRIRIPVRALLWVSVGGAALVGVGCGASSRASDAGPASQAGASSDSESSDGGSAPVDAGLDAAVCALEPEPTPRCADMLQVPALGMPCDEPGLICHDTWLVEEDPCRPSSASMSCCDGFWWGDYSFSTEPICPTLAPDQDPECPGPLVAPGACPREGLLCEYERSRARLCCEGSWRSVDCTRDDASCECPTPATLGLPSCADLGDVPPELCSPGGCQDGGFVTLAVSSDPMPRALGGTVRQGMYVMVELVQHPSQRSCLPIFGVELAATLRLGEEQGWFAQSGGPGGNRTRSVDFSHTASGTDIVFDLRCEEVRSFDSLAVETFAAYTATPDTLELFSPSCGYRASLERIAD